MDDIEIIPGNFFGLLRDAFHASESADNFDVDSNDPESMEQWDAVLREQADTATALIECVQEHGETIKQMLAKHAADYFKRTSG